MRDDYLKKAQAVIQDPNLLVNVVSKRIVQLREGHKPLIHTYEKLDMEDVALREIFEGVLTYRFKSQDSHQEEKVHSISLD